MTSHRTEVNGEAATLEDVRRVALFNFGHFTSMQFRDGGVRGLALHLERLAHATRELFGHELPASRVRACLAHALEGVDGPVSVRVNVFSRAADRGALAGPAQPEVMVALDPPARREAAPFWVRATPYERDAPQLKHTGTFGLFHQRRVAQQAGYDDALFVTREAHVSEGTTWNIGFHDGNGIVWPQAPMLDGVTLQLLRRALAARGIAQATRPVRHDELAGFRAAFALNTAFVARTIAGCDGHAWPGVPGLVESLVAMHDAEPAEPVGETM